VTFSFKISKIELGVAVHCCNSRTQEVEAGGSQVSRSAWAQKVVETVSKTKELQLQ
jgi:hypothetical protein